MAWRELDLCRLGALHGFFLAVERAGFGKSLARLPWPVSWAYAMAVVTFAWVFFRANDLASAWTYLAALAGRGPPAASRPAR